jgi:hypothetical protein
MSPTDAEAVLKDIEGVLQQLSRYHQLSEEQRLALHSRAGLVRQKIGDIVKLLKSLNKDIEVERQKRN